MRRSLPALRLGPLHRGRDGQRPAAGGGQAVSKPSTTIRGFKGIVNGEYDHLPEAAFYMVGTIEEAVAKGQKLIKEAA